jgi:hypothetical protein
MKHETYSLENSQEVGASGGGYAGEDGFDLLLAEFNFHNVKVLRVNGLVLGLSSFPV